MTSPDDRFREYFRSVTPTEFPPCPSATVVVPSSIAMAESRRGTMANRAVLAIAASVLFAFALTFAPSGANRKPDGENGGLLKDATAKGNVLIPKSKASEK